MTDSRSEPTFSTYSQASDLIKHTRAFRGIRILDVKLHQTVDGRILIGFDLISRAYEPCLLPLEIEKLYPDYELESRGNIHSYEILSEVINQVSDSVKTFSRSTVAYDIVQDNFSPIPYAKCSIIYELPVNRIAALIWLACFVHYINCHTNGEAFYYIDCIHFLDFCSGQSFAEFLNGKTNIQSIKDYHLADNDTHNLHLTLMKAIISLQNSGSYHSAIELIEKIYFSYKNDREKRINLAFSNYLQCYLSILYSDLDLKIEALKIFVRDSIQNEKKNLLIPILESRNCLAMKRLYATALNKIAYDGGTYKWTYIEWFFLRMAKFDITPDNKLFISTAENTSYQAYYAPRKEFHDIFEAEIKHLIKILELSFENDDLHNQLLFTTESSEKLTLLGINPTSCIISNLKKSLYKENMHRFFLNSYPVNDQETSINSLPTEIYTMIENIIANTLNIPSKST